MKKCIKFLSLIILLSVTLITEVNAETYSGEYSSEYLLRNYNLVALGYNYNGSNIDGIGNINFYEADGYNNGRNRIIEGNVLVNGNVTGTGNFGDDSDNVKSYVKGTIDDDIVTPSDLVRDANYIDFNKMYINIMNESKYLVSAANNHINSGKFEISSPGIYTVDNAATLIDCCESYVGKYNSLLIKNYDKNALYVFNYLNEFIDDGNLPTINIMERGSANSVTLYDYYNSGKYTGNIIFNFPNAREIDIDYDYHYGIKNANISGDYSKLFGFGGNIIAPKAVVTIDENYIDISYFSSTSYYISSIIANGIIIKSREDRDSIMQKVNYGINSKLIDTEISSYLKLVYDNSDDYYSRDYSIKDLLTNYSLVALGKKNLDSRSKLLNIGGYNSSVKLFHITGQALINGDVVFEDGDDRTAFDLISNEVTESNIKGSYGSVPNIVIQPWDNMAYDELKYKYQKNSLIVDYPGSANSGDGNYTSVKSNYINYDRLYENIVNEQTAIDGGKLLKKGEDNKIHVKVGGNYTIEDVNNIDEIIFDNFEDNKDKLTIITINNSGDVNFPLILKDTGDYKGIVTNDYFGKSEATHFYERNTFIQDSYYGNIVWNLPKATFVKLKANAPFAGHLIAPNADVETPETHFAGCFIVNSIYGEGNTEAHFYPLTIDTCNCEGYNSLSDRLKREATDFYLRKKLGGESSLFDTEIIGDRNQYNSDVSQLENVISQCKMIDGSNTSNNTNPIVSILSNPLTATNILIFIIVGSLIGLGIVFLKRKKINNN